MEKMSVPKLEVIHFNTEDVIVTSGNSAATSFIKATQLQGNNYFTLGSEVGEGSSIEEIGGNRVFYIFNIKNGSFSLYDNNTHLLRDINKEIYAWFDEDSKGWYTEMLPKTHYISADGITYDWRRNNRTN